MTRIIDPSGIVHYRHMVNAKFCLCGAIAFRGADDLFGGGAVYPLKETADQVTCTDCARVVCACRNEPYNTLCDSIDKATLLAGCCAAVEPDDINSITKGANA